jgi:hypothetical protein
MRMALFPDYRPNYIAVKINEKSKFSTRAARFIQIEMLFDRIVNPIDTGIDFYH